MTYSFIFFFMLSSTEGVFNEVVRNGIITMKTRNAYEFREDQTGINLERIHVLRFKSNEAIIKGVQNQRDNVCSVEKSTPIIKVVGSLNKVWAV